MSAIGGVGAIAAVVLTAAVAAAALGGSADGAFAGGIGGGLAPGSVPAQYAAAVTAAGSQCAAAPASVIAAQLQAESGFRPDAVSPVGAQGIAQFMPGTWATWGKDENGDGVADPFDPADAIPAQGRYDCALAAQLQPLLTAGTVAGDITSLMLAAYNAGPGAVVAAAGIPQNGETPAYVTRILTSAGTYAGSTGAGASGGTTGSASGASGSATGAAVVAAASRWQGSPYVWGGGTTTGPTGGGFDCSGLTLYAVYQATAGRVSLSHFTDYQLADPRGQRIPVDPVNYVSQLQPGDLIFFSDPTGRSAGGGIYHHVGIYAGAGQLLHAPKTGDVVKLEDLHSSYWQAQTWAAARFS